MSEAMCLARCNAQRHTLDLRDSSDMHVYSNDVECSLQVHHRRCSIECSEKNVRISQISAELRERDKSPGSPPSSET